MWTSLESIVKPKTVDEALELCQTAGARFLAGGSYLISEQDPRVTMLIDLTGLLKTNLRKNDETLVLGAGITLQILVESLVDPSDQVLAEAARCSVSSKNIRNQRTLGGEIARMRIDSELYVLFNALGATLCVRGKSGSFETSIGDWDRNGILTEIKIHRKALGHSALERYALLPSAPAFLIVCGAAVDHKIVFTVGGRARNTWTTACPEKEVTEETVRKFSETAADRFESDRYGSRDYKKMLLKTAFDRLRRKL